MRVAVPKETRAGECRVALVPESVKKLVKAGIEVVVERGAGEAAFLPNALYQEAGAEIEPDANTNSTTNQNKCAMLRFIWTAN